MAEPLGAGKAGRIALALLAALVLAQFGLAVWLGLLENTNSNGGDQGAFMVLGLDIRQGRALTDGNRHPLYPLLISSFARQEWSYFSLSKLISAVAGIAALGLTMILGRRLGGAGVGLGAGLLLSLNGEFLDQTPQALCEALLVGLALAAWWATARTLWGEDNWRRGALAGALLGLVYLCKGTGTLMIGAAALAALLAQGGRAHRRRGLWALGLALLLTVSPLLVYNWTRYGQPLYNFNSQHAMWFDSWDDRYLPADQWPTLASYARTHSLGEALTRLGGGILMVLPVAAEAWSILGWIWTGWLALGGTVACGAWGLWRLANRRKQGDQEGALAGLLGLLLVAFVLFFGWFAPVTDAPRFFLPLAAPAYLVAAHRTATWVGDRLERGPSALLRWGLSGAAAAVLLAVAAPTARADLARDLFRSDREVNAAGGDVVAWLNERVAPDGRVLWGPSHELPKWLFRPGLEPEPIPDGLDDWDGLLALIQERGYGHLVLDKKMYKRREAALEAGFDKNGEVILFRTAPQDWRYAYSRQGEEVNWYVLETAASAGPIFALWDARATVGPATLTGAGLRAAPLGGEARYEAALTWQTAAPMERNLTVFVHLLDGSGERVGQSDALPLGGMYPTSFWQPGEAVHDRHTLAVSQALPDGEYALLVGLYDSETRDRQPVANVAGAAQVGSDALLLPFRITQGEPHPLQEGQ